MLCMRIMGVSLEGDNAAIIGDIDATRRDFVNGCGIATTSCSIKPFTFNMGMTDRRSVMPSEGSPSLPIWD
jgi:hypothetical protein